MFPASYNHGHAEGCKQFMSDSAIWVVRFSWICKRRAITSTMRATWKGNYFPGFGR